MKKILLPLFVLLSFSAFSQKTDSLPRKKEKQELQNYRPDDFNGVNVYEAPKDDSSHFEKLKVKVGGDFALQFQGLRQSNSGDSLVKLVSDFNLPTANLNLDVQLEDGVRMHLRTYLSTKHHNETYVKGGYLQVDKLDFIKKDFLAGLMKLTTIKVGVDEINYGDAHFRRTDNARAIYNPFVGNYIMDAFTTEAFGEVLLRKNSLLLLIGLSNGKLNQTAVATSTTDNKISFYGKIGFDKQFSEKFRARLTGSWYTNQGTSTGNNLYGGDRAGGRYYNVMEIKEGDNDFGGRFNPRFKQSTSIQINPFVKYKGLEFFGIYEVVMNSKDQGNGIFTQLAAELLYRLGGKEQFYVGGRYNSVSGKSKETSATQTVDRFNVGGGWFMTKNILAKLEYVSQRYSGAGWDGQRYQGAWFNGFMIEAAISF